MESTNFSTGDSPNLENTGPALTPPAAKPSAIHKIFFGSEGLRAGWGLFLFIVMLGILIGGTGFVIHALHLAPGGGPKAGQELPLGFSIIGEALPFFCVLLVSWIMSKIENRPFGAYGLGGPRPVFRFVTGVGWGAVCLSLLVGILAVSGLLVFDGRLLFGMATVHYGLLWFLGFLFVGLLEEYLTRGYLLFTLARGIAGIYCWLFKKSDGKAVGFWSAALILSVLFGLGHQSNAGESPVGIFAAGLVGLVFCLSLWRTGSLWWAIGFHAAWDWAQSYLYGVADSGTMVQHHLMATHPVGTPLLSGGATGPEGSIFVLGILGLTCVIIVFTLPRTGWPTADRAKTT